MRLNGEVPSRDERLRSARVGHAVKNRAQRGATREVSRRADSEDTSCGETVTNDPELLQKHEGHELNELLAALLLRPDTASGLRRFVVDLDMLAKQADCERTELAKVVMVIASRPQRWRLEQSALDPTIRRAVDHVEKHIDGQLSIKRLAGIACLSNGHFARRFKSELGESVGEYVSRRRCETARTMCVHTTEPLCQIAYECGFSNQAHMTTSLKRRYGQTPGSFRKESKRLISRGRTVSAITSSEATKAMRAI